jgi:hypothetical protein
MPANAVMPLRAIYLHGFASSPRSSKAAFIGRQLRAHGIEVHTPDLNLPDFSTLTVTRMVGETEGLIDASDEPLVLIGSSLGGFVAVNVAARWPSRVQYLVLLAPAIDFAGPLMGEFGQTAIDDWQRAGSVHVFHFGYGRLMPIHHELYADARRYDALHARLPMPVIVFQGRRDTAVDPATVAAWCEARPHVQLHLLDDDHQLASSLDDIWEKIAAFLQLTAP